MKIIHYILKLKKITAQMRKGNTDAHRNETDAGYAKCPQFEKNVYSCTNKFSV